MKHNAFFCLLLFFTINVFAQKESFESERPFIEHLTAQNLFSEKIYYLKSWENEIGDGALHDTIDYQIGISYWHNDMPDSSFHYLEKSYRSFKNDTNFRRIYSCSQILIHQYDSQKKWFESFDKKSEDSVLIMHYLSARLLSTIISNDELNSLKRVNHDFEIALNKDYPVKRKSPMKAGILSAVIPGSGKLYVGKKYQFFSAFIINSLLGAQCYEAYRKDGANSIRFGITGALFAVFYISNIWGSVLSAKQYHVEHYKQLEDEVVELNRIATGK